MTIREFESWLDQMDNRLEEANKNGRPLIVEDLFVHSHKYKVMDVKDVIAQNEFGLDYDQLGPNEKEWVNDEIDNRNW